MRFCLDFLPFWRTTGSVTDELNTQEKPEGVETPKKRGGRPLGSKNKKTLAKLKKPYTGKPRGRHKKIRTVTAEQILEKIHTSPSASNSKTLSDQLFSCGYGLQKMMEILDKLSNAKEQLWQEGRPVPDEDCPQDIKALQFVYNALERAHGTIFVPVPQKVDLPPNLILMWNEIKSMPMDALVEEDNRGNGKNRVQIQHANADSDKESR